ncbi:MAG: MFS transporter [Proteobacteria bacterium]|nr:MFS transporter [Pseudomonadota bacterium]
MKQQKSYKNFVIIFFLGISSGLPLALILSTLKAFLLERGFDLKTIGFFSLVSLPYTIKFCFAPIIDSCSIPFLTRILGQRKSWIIITQIALAISIFALGIAGLTNDLAAIATFAFLVAFASASQDIVIDGYRIELIKKEDQGLAASFYVYGYRIGMLISGAGALGLAEIISWDSIYFIMAGLALSTVLITIFADETRKNFQQKSHNFSSWIKQSVVDPFVDFTHRKQWYTILAFIIFFKLGDVFAGNLTLPFLLEVGFSKIEIASIVKTFGLFATLFGVFIGGILVKKLGVNKSLWIAAFLQMSSNLTFSYLAQVGYSPKILYLVIFIENFSGGIGDAVFVAYLSSLCSSAFSATQYAVLVSFATFSRSLLTSSAGMFAETLGWYKFFILSTFLALPGIIFLLLITRKILRKN